MNKKNDNTNITFDINDAISAVRIAYPDYDIHKLTLRSRKREIVEPRQIVQFLLMPIYAFTTIGRFTGGYDHSTVISSKHVINDRMDTERTFKRQIENIKSEFDKSRHLRLFGLHESGEPFCKPETWIPHAPADNIAFAFM